MARNSRVGDCMPFLVMVLVQVCYSGMNITSKVAMESGMNPLVLVSYRQIFATVAIAPFSLLMEWKTRPKITLPILFHIFLCSLTGAVANQVFYFIGLKYSTAIIASALSNILPAVTFLLAVIFRQESAELRMKEGMAKVAGTLLCVGGAMLLSFYHGQTINLGESNIHWSYLDKAATNSTNSIANSNPLLGPLFIILSTVGWAAWFIIQAGMSEKFPAPYTTTTLMCLMASVECGAIGLVVERDMSAWSLRDGTRLVASLYAGVLGSAVAFFLTSWSIQRKGPLYVSVFSPLVLIIVAILSWALLSEKINVGTYGSRVHFDNCGALCSSLG
ncbi:Plant-drug/metabolite exporter [Parasponia andersonii]|uniref:WAT1-related protein n=1 Tax=Parasponia andersonii TaxID=3476 RepID=A0A2P5D8I0_PARAD|nr:Plant-drug/metabolite exporter [Parasponia andersonii]